MDREKLMHKKSEICEILEGMEREELKKPGMVTYYKDLAKLHHYMGEICEGEGSRRSMGMGYSGRDGIEWGAYAMDGSQRRGRDAMGRYTSMDAYGGMSYGMEPKEQIRQLMQDPGIGYDAKEALRKAMETMR